MAGMETFPEIISTIYRSKGLTMECSTSKILCQISIKMFNLYMTNRLC